MAGCFNDLGLILGEYDIAEQQVEGEQFAVSQDYLNLGQTHITKDQHAEALAEFKNAVEKLRPLFETNPHRYRASYAHLLYHIAWMHRLIRQPDEALEAYGATRELTLRLVEENQTVTAHRELLARVCNGIAAVCLDQQQFEPAVEPLELGLAIATQLVEDSPHVLPYQQQLLQYRNNLAIAYAEVGRVADAITQLEETVLGLENLVAGHPTNEQRMFLASARNNLALRYRSTGRIDAAREVAERAIDEMQTLVDNNPETPRYRLMLGGACSNQGELIREQGNARDAMAWYRRALEALHAAKQSMPNVSTVDQFLRNAHFGVGKSHEDLGRFQQAVDDYDAALTFKGVPFQNDLRIAKARTLARMGKHAEAIDRIEELLEEYADQPEVIFYAIPVFVVASRAILADEAIDVAAREAASAELSDRCVQLLYDVRESGLFNTAENVTALRTNSGFDPLRGRADFQELLATVDREQRDRADRRH